MSDLRPSVAYRPRIFIDGNQWCAQYGENGQDGVSGFGDSPREAMRAFDLAWDSNLSTRPSLRDVEVVEKADAAIVAPTTMERAVAAAHAGEMFAIWEYDRYPYVLCGKLISIGCDGWATVEGYSGRRFKPLAVIPRSAGENLRSELEKMKADHSAAKRRLFESDSALLRMALTRYGVTIPDVIKP